jgi:ribosomal-protein-alanine N-acetyltransferase
MTPILETDRLLLRPFVAADLDWLARLYTDEETRRFFPVGVLDRERTREELDWFIAGGDPAFPGLVLGALVEKASGQPVGRAGMLGWELEGRRETEIAYLVARERWGDGFGTEIARALVHHGFETLGLTRLIALIHPDNRASVRTAERAGLAFERRIALDGTPCLIHAIERWQDKAGPSAVRLEAGRDSVQA